jgi:hypothetical protein
MPRRCTVCAHPERAAIDTQLVRGEAFRRIAAQRQLSEQAVRRHHADHLPAALARAEQASELIRADGLLAEVRDLQSRALAILGRAEEAGDLRAATGAVREARSTIELLARLTGELNEKPELNVVLAPQWLAIRSVITDALRPYPDAGAAVSARLLELSAGQ